MYVTTDDGVYKSTTGGGDWSVMSDGIPNRFLQALAIDPVTPQTVYVGVHVYTLTFGDGRNGVYKSTDGGDSWVAKNSGLTNKFVSTLTITPGLQPTLYAGTYGLGLFKSLDGGQHWAFADNDLPSSYIQALVFDPQTPTTLYVSTSDAVFKSTDAGDSWLPASTGLPGAVIGALAVDPHLPDTLYATHNEYTPDPVGTLFKSVNGGANWSESNAGLPDDCYFPTIIVDPQTPGTLYVGTSNGYTGCGVFKSINGGDSWDAVNAGLPNVGDPEALVRVNALAIDPQMPLTLYAGVGDWFNGGTGVYKSTDGGGQWQSAATGLPDAPITNLIIDPETPQTLYASTFDITSGYGGHGVYQSTDGGSSWQPINTGLTNPFVLPLAIDPASPQLVYAGAFGGGVFVINLLATDLYLPLILRE